MHDHTNENDVNKPFLVIHGVRVPALEMVCFGPNQILRPNGVVHRWRITKEIEILNSFLAQ